METNSNFNYNDIWDYDTWNDNWVACIKAALVLFIILAVLKILKMGYKLGQKCWCHD